MTGREGRIVCPRCATVSTATMPEDACLYFHDCPACAATLRPEPGDCCVFCSYGDAPCPPVRAEAAAGRGLPAGGDA